MKNSLALAAVRQHAPFALISLWDVIDDFKTGLLISAIDGLGAIKEKAHGANLDEAVPQAEKDRLLVFVGHLIPYCTTPDMRTSSAALYALRRGLDGVDNTDIETWRMLLRELQSFETYFKCEMSKRKLLIIPSERSGSLRNPEFFGKPVYDAFPLARIDIEEAGNCLALDLNTAAVFHLMRASEFGLRALAEELQAIPQKWPIEFSQWSDVIMDIKNKLDAQEQLLMQMTKGTKKDEALERYRALLAEVNHIKLSRDRVMHTRAFYDSGEAEGQHHLIRGFMERLAKMILKPLDSDFQI